LYLQRPDGTQAALADFDTAIRLAPQEEHLRALRDRAAGTTEPE
jgi:hypothetical protein